MMPTESVLFVCVLVHNVSYLKNPLNHSVDAPHFRVYPNGTLSISAATADNEGNYLCKADNGVGEAISKLAHVGINGEWSEWWMG